MVPIGKPGISTHELAATVPVHGNAASRRTRIVQAFHWLEDLAIAPALLHLECTNLLRMASRRGRLIARQAHDALRQLRIATTDSALTEAARVAGLWMLAP